jgi:diacylglycerol kinase (ATP)
MARFQIIKDIFRPRRFADSLKIASQGLIYLFLYHRNMRVIFILGVLALILGFYLGLKGIELAALCITVTLVFTAEIFNTAVELMMDMLTQEYKVKIRLVKDIAAAVVLIASLNALAVGYILFIRKILR